MASKWRVRLSGSTFSVRTRRKQAPLPEVPVLLLERLEAQALGLGVLEDVPSLLPRQLLVPQVVHQLHGRSLRLRTGPPGVEERVVQGPDLLGPELPGPHPHRGQPSLEPVPEAGERPEATGVFHPGEAIDILEQQGLAEDAPVQWTVAVPPGEEEKQLGPPERLLPEPLHLGLDVGPA